MKEINFFFVQELMAKEEEKARMPHFSNLNEDPALTNKLVHMIKPGVIPFQTIIGFKVNSLPIVHTVFIYI